ncbi:MAG: ribose-phosphate pyrophosphokinase [Clostridiales bacterium]|nr:ribose-phosphate pyrophosphokinase [Bacillota bacterium]NLL53686.1 ribose-phosphate pyrophosphokinase [Clostridiales bacterium]
MFQETNIAVFAGSGGYTFAERMCRFMYRKLGSSQVIKFSDGNIFVRINESVRDRNVYLVQPIGTNPNDEFVEILFFVDALKRSNALSVTLVMPYFGYAKGDKKDEPRVSIRARVCAESMELAGCDRFITMDLHSPQVQGFFKNPMDHLYAMPMLCEMAKRRYDLSNAVIVSPDAGFTKQARKFAAWLNLPLAIGDKQRFDHSENAQILEVLGHVDGKDCLITDDFTTSGGTLVNVAHALKKRGARSVRAMLSHNIVSKQGVELINSSPIDTVLSTDTIFNPNIVGQEKFKTISVAPMFAETIIRYYNSQSINDMFTALPENIVQAGLDMANS